MGHSLRLALACLYINFLITSFAYGQEQIASPLPFSGEVTLEGAQQGGGQTEKSSKIQIVAPKDAPDLSCIKKRGVLVVAMLEDNVPPFIMEDEEGNPYGIDVRLAEAMAAELEVKVAFNRNAKTFDEVVEMVLNRQADIGLSKLSLTLNRAEKVKFSDPYVSLNKAVLVNRLALEKIRKVQDQSVEDLLNQPQSSIGVEAGSSYVEYAKRIFPKANVIEFAAWEHDIIPKVFNGELLATFRDEWAIREAMYVSPKSYFKNLSIIIKGEPDDLMAIVPWNSSQLLEWINRFFKMKRVQFDSDSLMKTYKELRKSKVSGRKGGTT